MISSQDPSSPPCVQVRALARDAFDRAQARRRPFIGVALALDDRDLLTRAFGEPWVATLDAALREDLRAAFAGDAFLFVCEDGLRLWTGALDLERASAAAEALIRTFGARTFDAPSGPRRQTISVGLAASERADPAFDPRLCYETLEGVAAEGLRVAQGGGGGRLAHSELYAIVQRGLERREPRALDAQERRIAELTHSAPPPAPEPAPGPGPSPVASLEPDVTDASPEAPPPAPGDESARALPPTGVPVPTPDRTAARADLGAAVHELLTGLTRGAADLGLVERSLEAILAQRLRDERARAFEQAERRYGLQVDRIERRLGKLNQALVESEARIAAHVGRAEEELGESSAYRAVQGLSHADAQFERKRQLMEQIFAANLAMQGGEPPVTG